MSNGFTGRNGSVFVLPSEGSIVRMGLEEWKAVILLAFLLPGFAIFPPNVQAFLCTVSTTASTPHVRFRTEKESSTVIFQSADSRDLNNGLNIAIVGAGPSGLLLSHLLLKEGKHKRSGNRITLFDGRSDPRTKKLEGRAYALGIGIRGRTAIRAADPALWEAVKARGYESERFNLHFSVSEKKDLVIPLRSDSKPSKDSSSIVEPSLLIYQSELCASLLEKLEEAHTGNESDLEVHLDTSVVDCDLDAMTTRAIPPTDTDTNGANPSSLNTEDPVDLEFGPFDLIIGADGVNSIVRSSIDRSFPEFATTKESLPGVFKVVRLDYPVGATSEDGGNAFDPKAVSLLIPSGAFIEPTGNDGSCCILLSGRGGGDTKSLPLYLTETKNVTAIADILKKKFPRWREESFGEISQQLVAQDLSMNSAVTCNTYHYRDKAALVGDAAHGSGGVSGQGVNSALVDVVVLAECLWSQMCDEGPTDQEGSLLKYSMRQVPEGRALHDLSFGPKPKGLKKKVLWSLRNVRDALFQGRLGIGEKTLQTRLSSELTSFATIRRERDYFYKDDEEFGENQSSFPSEEEFQMQLQTLHEKSGGRKLLLDGQIE